MNTKKIKFLFAGLALTLFSCDNYLDINEDPNNIHKEDIHPGLMLPGALSTTYRTQAITMNRLGNIYMQNWGANVNNFTSANNDEYSLAIDNTFYSGIWDGLYRNTANFQNIINYESEEYDNHKAVAYIMKAFYMQYIVDLYGDCPYTDAFKGQELPTPTYDDDQLVYKALIASIDAGIAKFYAADSNDKALGGSDIVFNDNPSKWLRFANTLKLRILMRQSGLTDAATQTYIDEQLDVINASGVFVEEDVTINPGYNKSSTAGLNPFYSVFRLTNDGDTPTAGYHRATAYVSDFLNGVTNGVVDPRRGSLYKLQGGLVVGAVQGAVTGPENMSPIGDDLIYPGGGDGYDADGVVMSLAEAKFILSEVELKYPGKISGLDAETLFNQGIAASFNYLGASMGSYMSNISGVAGLGWTGNLTQSIMTQKWLATNGINAIEAYIDYTRTGFPNVPLATTAQYSNRPYRLLYPSSEYISNAANVPNITLPQVFVQGPFWKN